MPQMMPMNWIFLFSYFLILFITFNIFLFYSTNLNPTEKKFNSLNIPQHWTW